MGNFAAALRCTKEAGLELYARWVTNMPELAFLGHRITASGIVPLREKIASIPEAPVPTYSASLWSFLGLVKY